MVYYIYILFNEVAVIDCRGLSPSFIVVCFELNIRNYLMKNIGDHVRIFAREIYLAVLFNFG